MSATFLSNAFTNVSYFSTFFTFFNVFFYFLSERLLNIFYSPLKVAQQYKENNLTKTELT